MLTYKDRLALLRSKKIEHTLLKRKQQGYMDADDYGTVPLPEGYHFEAIPNSPNGGFYGLTGMADNFCKLLDSHPTYVDPLEIMCGRWRDMLVNYRMNKRWDELRFPYEELKPYQKLYNITSGIDNDSHLACDYTIGLKLGFPGLMEKLKYYRQQNPDNKEFYEAEIKVLNSIMGFVKRHIDEIGVQLEKQTAPELIATLKEMLSANCNLLHSAPKTFLEACQWVSYFNCVSRIYTRDGAGFQLDVLLKPYYDNDIKNGILDDEKARFILSNLLLIDTHYYQISGVDENGNDITNHLSYLVLKAADDINIAANITVRVHPDCDKKILKQAVEYLFKNKNGWPRFCGDLSLVKGYVKSGCDKKTARDRIAVGCNWMCVPGREFPMNDTVKINIAKVFMVAFDEMMEKKVYSCERLFELFEKHLKFAVDITAKGVNLHIDNQAEVTPELIMNLMMRNTIEKGLDISKCAELYTIGVDGAGLAVVADSFGALHQRIENEKLLDWSIVATALKNDFSGTDGERIRQILSSSHRYCEGGTVADEWAQRITGLYTTLVSEYPMTKNRKLIPGWFSWSRTIEYGSVVGATPNGRHKGKPISHGANPNPGFRKDGAVTSMANGIASVQPGYGNTAPLQLEFDPKISAQNGGVERVVNMIETHFKMGGTLININILDGDKLMEANKNPDLYPDLVVRVTGFTAYFATLSPEFRQLVVDRFVEGL